MKNIKLIFIFSLLIICLIGCAGKPNCIDKLIACKIEFNTVREQILLKSEITMEELENKYNPITQAINTELNILLQKARQNKAKPFELCDEQVQVFCDDVDKLTDLYEGE